jgi:hypothetical protein
MHLIRKLTLIFILAVNLDQALAQDTLPAFTVKNRMGRVIVSWVNTYDSVSQMNIQRSPDSLKGFKTILTVADPSSITNGYLDGKAPDTRQFYRIFVMRTGGKYFFTRAQRPVLDSGKDVRPPSKLLVPKEENPSPIFSPPSSETNLKPATIPTATFPNPAEPELTKTHYSIAKNNRPLNRVTDNYSIKDSLKIRIPEINPLFTPSVHVFSNVKGDVEIALPDNKSRSFSLKFYTEDGKPLFQMNKIHDNHLTLDKSNFFRSGWVQFELYEDGKLKEKHKVYVTKDQR